VETASCTYEAALTWRSA